MKKQAPTGIGACFIQRFMQRQTNPVERNVFVGLVNRRFFVFHFRTESAAAFQCAGIGSAADRNGFVVAPGMAVVNVHQGGNQFAFGVVVKRFLIMREFKFNARIFKRFAHFFRLVRSGEADIRGDYKRAVLDFRNVGRHSQKSRFVAHFA